MPEPYVKYFGILLDSNLSFSEHTVSLVSTLLGTLGRINTIKHLFSRSVLLIILNSSVFSKGFYCSTVWAGPSKQNIVKLQLLQNFAARILTNKRKCDHVSPALHDLGWLSVKDHLNLRDVTLLFKMLNGLAPPYLSCKLAKRSESHSYSSRNWEHLNIPLLELLQHIAPFFLRAVKLWNRLGIHSNHSLKSVKKATRQEILRL